MDWKNDDGCVRSGSEPVGADTRARSSRSAGPGAETAAAATALPTGYTFLLLLFFFFGRFFIFFFFFVRDTCIVKKAVPFRRFERVIGRVRVPARGKEENSRSSEFSFQTSHFPPSIAPTLFRTLYFPLFPLHHLRPSPVPVPCIFPGRHEFRDKNVFFFLVYDPGLPYHNGVTRRETDP